MLFWRNGAVIGIVALRSQYGSILRSCAAPLKNAVCWKSSTWNEKIFLFWKAKNAGILKYFKWWDKQNGKIFRFRNCFTLIALSVWSLLIRFNASARRTYLTDAFGLRLRSVIHTAALPASQPRRLSLYALTALLLSILAFNIKIISLTF